MPEYVQRRAPQRIIRLQEVCDTCGAVDSFRVLYPYRGTVYVQCKACGRYGTRTTVAVSGKKSVPCGTSKG